MVDRVIQSFFIFSSNGFSPHNFFLYLLPTFQSVLNQTNLHFNSRLLYQLQLDLFYLVYLQKLILFSTQIHFSKGVIDNKMTYVKYTYWRRNDPIYYTDGISKDNGYIINIFGFNIWILIPTRNGSWRVAMQNLAGTCAKFHCNCVMLDEIGL